MAPVSPRITVLGASGVGKTTLAAALAAKLDVVHVDSDAYYHLPTDPPYRTARDPHERRALLERDLAPHRGWVLSGGAVTWAPAPRLDLDLVVLLWLPIDVRIARLVARERALYGARIAEGGDMARDHDAFLRWTRGYDDGSAEGTNTLPLHEAYLRAATCPVVRIEGPVAIEDTIARVVARLG